MAVKDMKDMGASVLARLKKQAREKGINYQTCLQLFVQEEFLRKLEMSPYVENFVLKGGMFLYTISNFEGRPTMDIDFMLRRLSNDVVAMERLIKDICAIDTGNDFLIMEAVGVKEIIPEKKYPGIGISMMAHIKNVRVPFSLDIGVDDVIIPGAVRRIIETRLEGFKKPSIYTYSLESAMAEKFDAIIKRMTATSRMKDFYDIYYWSQMYEYDGRVLQEAVFETLQHRGTPYEKDSIEQIKAFAENSYLVTLWNNYYPGPGIDKPKFSEVVVQIDVFLGPVFSAILKEEEFFGQWSTRENAWKG